MQHDDAVYDRGEFEVFAREAAELIKHKPEPSLEDFDDSFWKRFTESCERDAAARELGLETESAPNGRERLRAARSLESDKDRDDRRKAVIRRFLKHQPNADGEPPEAIVEEMRQLLRESF